MNASHKDAEAGTVLLSTLLVLSLMSAVALALLATVRSGVTTAQRLGETAQADLYADGVTQFAQAQLTALAELQPIALNARFAAPQTVALPYEGGAIQATLRDGTHCLRLSALTDGDGAVSEPEVIRLETLFELLGVPGGDARQLAARIADWVDMDSVARPGGEEDGGYMFRDPPHRTANVPLSSIAELRAIEGMTERVFQTIRPHLCIGQSGTATRFNIDTARQEHLPVMAALIGAEQGNVELAQSLLQNRPQGGYETREALLASVPLAEAAARPDGFDPAVFIFVPQRVEVEALVTFGGVERAQRLGFEGVDKGAPRLTYRDWGRASFRPVAQTDREDTGSRDR